MKALALVFLAMGIGFLRADQTDSNQAPVPSAVQNAQPSPAPPKSGQSLGTITTTDGKTYADAKLAVVEPDGISIIYSDGGAKIPFSSLSPEMQKEFGYDPEKSAFYAREQQYLAQIDRLQQENAQLRKRLNIASNQDAAPSATASSGTQNLKPTMKGYNYFFNYLKNQSGPFGAQKRGTNHYVYQYPKGPFQGMTEGDAKVYAQQQWEALPSDQQVAYEQKAQMYGPGPDPNTVTTPPKGATMYNSDGTTTQVQFQ